MNSKKDALWTREFILMSLANLGLFSSIYMLMPTLPKYAASVLGANKIEIGYTVAFASLAAIIMRPLAGYLLDSYNRRTIYLIALGGVTLVMFSYNLASTLVLLLLIRIAHGIFSSTCSTSGQTIIGELLPPSRRGEGVGYYGLCMTIAMASGPYLGLLLSGDNTYYRLFLASTIMAAAGFVLILPIKLPKREVVKRPLNLSTLIEAKVLPLSALVVCIYFSYGGIISFVSLFSDELHIKNGSGMFFLVLALALAITRPLTGKFFDRKGPKKILSLGFVILLVGYVSLSQSRNIWGILIAAVLVGVGNGLSQPTLFAMILEMVPRTRTGAATSTLYAAVDVGNAGGAVMLGWMAGISSLSTAFLFSGLIMVIPLIYFNLSVFKHYQKVADQVAEVL